MKRFWILLTAFLSAFSFNAEAQNTVPSGNRQQYYLRAGLVNYEVGGDFRLSRRLVWHSDVGYGLNYFKSNYYNCYLNTSAPCVYTSDALDFGMDWWAFHFNNEVRYLPGSGRIYVGLKVKVTFPEGFIFPSGYSGREWFLSTYKIGPVVGIQKAFGKSGRWHFDAQLGGGVLLNHAIDFGRPVFISNTRIGYVFFRK